MSSSYHMGKMSSKQRVSSSKLRVPMTYTLEKRFFRAAIFNICESLLFRGSKKVVVYFGLYQFSLHC